MHLVMHGIVSSQIRMLKPYRRRDCTWRKVFKEVMKVREVIWRSPDPIRLVSLQEEGETPRVCVHRRKAM